MSDRDLAVAVQNALNTFTPSSSNFEIINGWNGGLRVKRQGSPQTSDPGFLTGIVAGNIEERLDPLTGSFYIHTDKDALIKTVRGRMNSQLLGFLAHYIPGKNKKITHTYKWYAHFLVKYANHSESYDFENKMFAIYRWINEDSIKGNEKLCTTILIELCETYEKRGWTL